MTLQDRNRRILKSLRSLRPSGLAIVMLLVLASNSLADAGNSAAASYGFSPMHTLKYKKGFTSFDYVNPKAPKGGTLTIGAVGTYSSLNTLKWPGATPRAGTQGFYMRRLIYDTLLKASADEIAGYYGLLAVSVEVPIDQSWVRFKINPKAKWHDGKPITAEDVKFTFATLVKQGAPFYRQSLRGIKIIVEDNQTVLIKAARSADRGFVSMVGSIPIHPKHYWQTARLAKGNMDIPLGSGPYRIKSANAGSSLMLERVIDYWAANHPVNTGRYNFDLLKVTFYRDSGVAMEAFRAGEYNFRIETDGVRWNSAYAGTDLNRGIIQRMTVESKKAGQIFGLVFNVRRPAFQDLRVRKAIALAYDFEWINKNLYHGMYKSVSSYFGGTYLAATGEMSESELQLLGKLATQLPLQVLKSPGPKMRRNFHTTRSALRRAAQLLDEAGFRTVDGKRIDPSIQKPFRIEVVYMDPRIEKPLSALAGSLKRLGITLDYHSRDPSSAGKMLLDHQFDMAALSQWSPGLLPGPGERLLWGSKLADKKGSYALSGVKDKALDIAIAAMNKARSAKDMEIAGRTFDRLMRWGQYMVPFWRNNDTWIAWRSDFSHPEKQDILDPGFIDTWWATKKTQSMATQ